MKTLEPEMTVRGYITQCLTPDIKAKGYSILSLPLDSQHAVVLYTVSLGVHPIERFAPEKLHPQPENPQ